MATNKLSVLKVNTKQGTNWNEIIDRIVFMNTEDSRCIINEQTNDYIGGCFLFFSLYNQTIYNIEENKFETTPAKKQNIIKFDIFISADRMLLWGNKKTSDLFITTLSQASNNGLIIEHSNIDFISMIRKILKNPYVSFSKMKITDIVIDEGIVANCSVDLGSLDNPDSLVKKYMDSVSQLTVIISKEINPVSITLYSNGSVLIYKDRGDIDDEVINLINNVIGGEV